MSKICPKCGSSFYEKRVVQNINHNPPHDITYRHESVCGACYHVFQTVFDRITVSPEVLAEEFVEMMYDRVAGDYRYYSMLTGEFYNSREEAIAATVKKLNEVYNGQ